MRRFAGVERFGLALGIGLIALTAPARAQIGEMKTFRDWTAGCDNTGACAAVSLPGMDDEPAAWLRLDRPAGADGTVTLALKLRGEGLKAPLTATLSLDGAPFPAKGRSWPVTSPDGETASIALAPAEADALIAGARKATALRIGLGKRETKVSLAGSVAALLWIDERQGRLNTTSALIRKGTGTSVPAARPAPAIAAAKGASLPKDEVAALTKELRAALKRRDPDACEEGRPGMPEMDDAWRLDGDLRLVSLGCSMGAYNLTSGFWLVRGKDVAGATPAAFPQADGKPTHELVNADFDPATGQLGFFAKGRGLGDCGAAGSYGWTGSAFAILAFTAMGECRGIGPDDWITLYRSAGK